MELACNTYRNTYCNTYRNKLIISNIGGYKSSNENGNGY